MITQAQSSSTSCASLQTCARPIPRVLILFLSGTLLFSAAMLSGCAGVTSAKGGSTTTTASETSTTNQSSVAPAALSASPASVAFGNVSVGSSSNQSLTITNSGGTAATISQASASGTGFSLGGVTLPATLNPGTSATFTATFAPGATGSASGTASFTSAQLSSAYSVSMSGAGVGVAPSIVAQPVSISILVGQTATFSVTATGTAPLAYQWKMNGTAIAGATGSTYTTPTETTSNNGAQFTVAVSNAAGTVISNAATLTVTTTPVAPSITTQPSNQTIFAGQTATFSVVANGTSPLSYQWSQNGTAIGGATSSSYTTPTETTSNSGATFSVVVSNSAGNAASNNATLTVNPDPVAPTITSQPASQTINAGQTATFSVTASGTAPLSYQWLQNGTAIGGATSSSYTTPVESVSNSGTHFSVTVSNTAGSVTSNTATLTVNGVIGALNPSTNSLNFNSVTVTMNSTLPVIFTNAGTASITISSVTVSGTGFTGSGISTNQVVPAGQSATLNVTFAPTAAGSPSGSVVLVSNATDPSITVTLSGTGVVHSAALSWTASVSSGVTGYNVYRGTVLGTYTQINPVLVTSDGYTDTQVNGGTTYYYVVTAVSPGGQSGYSTPATAPIP
jgi:ASPM-SPD-2-Hydin domain-containing protein/Ig-like domain-containing protein